VQVEGGDWADPPPPTQPQDGGGAAKKKKKVRSDKGVPRGKMLRPELVDALESIVKDHEESRKTRQRTPAPNPAPAPAPEAPARAPPLRRQCNRTAYDNIIVV